MAFASGGDNSILRVSDINSLQLTNEDDNITNDNPEISATLQHPGSFDIDDDEIHNCDCELGRKTKEIKLILNRVRDDDAFGGMVMIDAIQRLGIDHYFQDEIEQFLQRQFTVLASTDHHHGHHHNDIQQFALRFRLLRQQGYSVSADGFNNLRNKEGEFKQRISEDINGLISLYESSQLSIGGEDVLDGVGELCTNLLNELCGTLQLAADYDMLKLVKHVLVHPRGKSLPLAKNFFHGYFQGYDYEWMVDLQDLAELNFKMAKSLHQKEIVQIYQWWKELGLSKKLEFARDQPLKWYVWSTSCFTDPSLSWQRIELTKPISLIYIIDDIFDLCGTLDVLTLFTEAINRWDISGIHELPEYMKICFEALNDVTNEISNKVKREHGYNPLHSLRKAWGSLCNAFLKEAKWFASGELPKAEEYLENGIVSSGVHVGLVHIFFLLGQHITNENVQLIDSNPPIISSIATILRLWDDLGTAKDENQDGKDGSYINYYMMEHQSTAEDAKKHAMNKISEAWKRLNKECLSPNPFSGCFKRACLNTARMVPLMYSYDDKQRLPSLEDYIKSLLYDNLPTRGVY